MYTTVCALIRTGCLLVDAFRQDDVAGAKPSTVAAQMNGIKDKGGVALAGLRYR